MSDVAGAERRREPRRRVLKAARILIDKKSVITCTARNMSAHGSRIAIDSVVGVPNEFVIEINGEDRHPARIVWKTQSELGIIFG